MLNVARCGGVTTTDVATWDVVCALQRPALKQEATLFTGTTVPLYFVAVLHNAWHKIGASSFSSVYWALKSPRGGSHLWHLCL